MFLAVSLGLVYYLKWICKHGSRNHITLINWNGMVRCAGFMKTFVFLFVIITLLLDWETYPTVEVLLFFYNSDAITVRGALQAMNQRVNLSRFYLICTKLMQMAKI